MGSDVSYDGGLPFRGVGDRCDATGIRPSRCGFRRAHVSRSAVVTALTTAAGMPTFAGRATAAGASAWANVGGGNLGTPTMAGNIGTNLGNNNLGSGNR